MLVLTCIISIHKHNNHLNECTFQCKHFSVKHFARSSYIHHWSHLTPWHGKIWIVRLKNWCYLGSMHNMTRSINWLSCGVANIGPTMNDSYHTRQTGDKGRRGFNDAHTHRRIYWWKQNEIILDVTHPHHLPHWHSIQILEGQCSQPM